MFFTTKDRIPKDRKITYANFICNIHPKKLETHRVRLTAGGDKIDYAGDPSSPAQTRQTTHHNQRPNYRQIAQAAVIQDRYQHHIDHLCTLPASLQHFTKGSVKQGKINN